MILQSKTYKQPMELSIPYDAVLLTEEFESVQTEEDKEPKFLTPKYSNLYYF